MLPAIVLPVGGCPLDLRHSCCRGPFTPIQFCVAPASLRGNYVAFLYTSPTSSWVCHECTIAEASSPLHMPAPVPGLRRPRPDIVSPPVPTSGTMTCVMRHREVTHMAGLVKTDLVANPKPGFSLVSPKLRPAISSKSLPQNLLSCRENACKTTLSTYRHGVDFLYSPPAAKSTFLRSVLSFDA